MKICGYCGKENEDASEFCSECGTAFGNAAEPALNDAPKLLDDIYEFFNQAVPSWLKCSLWLMAWGAVALAALSDDPGELRGALAFPVGFCGLLPAEPAIGTAFLGGVVVIGVGWGLYVWLALGMKKAKRLGGFSLFYLVFCALLALNVAGCRELITTAAGIHCVLTHGKMLPEAGAVRATLPHD